MDFGDGKPRLSRFYSCVRKVSDGCSVGHTDVNGPAAFRCSVSQTDELEGQLGAFDDLHSGG